MVALRREDLSPEELERQHGLDRSWVDAERALADPSFRGGLVDSIGRLEGRDPAPLLTRAEFLARTDPDVE